jgi:hypothetical protein
VVPNFLFLKATRKLCQFFLYLNMYSPIGIVLSYALTSNATLIVYYDCFVPTLYTRYFALPLPSILSILEPLGRPPCLTLSIEESRILRISEI